MTDTDDRVTDLPDDWVDQVFRAYETFGVNHADEFISFPFRWDPKDLAEKAKRQLRNVEGEWVKMRAAIAKNLGRKVRAVRGPDATNGKDPLFGPPKASASGGHEGAPSVTGPKPKVDPYPGWPRDAQGRVIYTEMLAKRPALAKGDHSINEWLEDSVDADGNPVKVLSKAGERYHAEQIAMTFEGVPKSKRERPLAIFMGGGSGSGKTTATQSIEDFPKTRELKKFGIDPPGEAALIDADAYKFNHPRWKELDPARAAVHTYQETDIIAELARDEGIRRGVDMVLDGTGGGGVEKMQGKMDPIRDAGYDVAGVYVTVPASEAMARAAVRGVLSGRHVPMSVIDTNHKSVTETFMGIKEGLGEKVDLYDTDVPFGKEGIPIILDGKVEDQGRLDTFVGKQEVGYEKSLRDAIDRLKDPSRSYEPPKDGRTEAEVRAKAVEDLEAALADLLKQQEALK